MNLVTSQVFLRHIIPLHIIPLPTTLTAGNRYHFVQMEHSTNTMVQRTLISLGHVDQILIITPVLVWFRMPRTQYLSRRLFKNALLVVCNNLYYRFCNVFSSKMFSRMWTNNWFDWILWIHWYSSNSTSPSNSHNDSNTFMSSKWNPSWMWCL